MLGVKSREFDENSIFRRFVGNYTLLNCRRPGGIHSAGTGNLQVKRSKFLMYRCALKD